MTVIANDFVPVQPYQTDVVTLGVRMKSELTGGLGLRDMPGWPTNRRLDNRTPCSRLGRIYAFRH